MFKLDCSSELFNEIQWKKNVDLEKQLRGGGNMALTVLRYLLQLLGIS